MAFVTPLYLKSGVGDPAITYSAQQDRAGLLGTIFSREGVLDKDANHLKVSQRGLGANLSVDVAAGRCAIMGDDVADQGTYVCHSTTVVNLSLNKPASGTYTHRIIARVRDKLANGVWAGYDWLVEVLPDVGSGTPSTPNSAISLATVAVSSTATSIVDANVTDTRSRASVGTPALTGNMIASGIHSGYGGRDATRPLTWSKNPDGWVQLAGWIRRSDPNTAISANTTYWFDGASGANPLLPADARPAGIRDFIGMTSSGYVHFAVYTSGAMSFRFNYNTTLVQNVTWFSFDNCMFRANAF